VAVPPSPKLQLYEYDSDPAVALAVNATEVTTAVTFKGLKVNPEPRGADGNGELLA
jgi:hypothetical protein